MSDYRTLNRTVLVKVETTSGTDAAPVVGTDAVLVENPQIAGTPAAIDTNEVTGALDPRAPVVGGGGRTFSCEVNLHSSGTGGTAPEWRDLIMACGFSETLRAADSSGTMQAGSTSTTANLAAAAPLMVVGDIITTTGGTGSGQTRVITAYSGTGTDIATIYPSWTVTPDATTTYTVRASALYVPISSSLVTSTIYDYMHASPAGVNSKLRKLLGWAGNVSFTLPVSGVGKANFQGQGKFSTPTDVAAPSAATYQSQRPVAFQNACVWLNNLATKLGTITIDIGNAISVAPDPADTFGVAVAGITRRRTVGRMNPPVALTSVRDVVVDFLAGTQRKLWLCYGTSPNLISFWLPTIGYTGSADADLDGFGMEEIPFAAQGENTGIYITVC